MCTRVATSHTVYMKSRVLYMHATCENGLELVLVCIRVHTQLSSPKSACNNAKHAAASQKLAGAAEVSGQGLEYKHKNQSTAFKKQNPDRWKLNQNRNTLRKTLPLRFRKPTFEAAKTFCSSRDSLWFNCGACRSPVALWGRVYPETINMTGRLTRGDKTC